MRQISDDGGGILQLQKPTLRFKFMVVLTLTFLVNVRLVSTVAIDNDILGEPDVECLDDEIRFWVKTRKYFAGRIYAKGKVEYPGCLKSDYTQERSNKPHFDLKFGACGMKSLRSVDPRGMYYGVTVVVSFHPLFITKVDQAFHVKCFFEEANRGLTAELGVSMIPTTEVEARHGIPGCTYSIHKSTIRDLDAGRSPGNPVQFARVGDKVLHRWHCDDNMFGVLINNCYVTDGFGQRADVVDSRGCPIDPILITGIRYSADLMTAYAESHVFKFADKPGVWFFCQIQMCMKAAGMCRGVTPPSCASIAPGPNGGTTGGGYTGTGTAGFTPFGPAFPTGFDAGGNAPINSNQKEVTTVYEAHQTRSDSFRRTPAEVSYRYENSDSPGVTRLRDRTVPYSLQSTSSTRRQNLGNSRRPGGFINPSSSNTPFPPPAPFDYAGGNLRHGGGGADSFADLINGQDFDDFEKAINAGGDVPAQFGQFLSELPQDVSIEDLQRVFLDQTDQRFLKNRSPRPTPGATTLPGPKLDPKMLMRMKQMKDRYDQAMRKKAAGGGAGQHKQKQMNPIAPSSVHREGLREGDRVDSVQVEWMNDDPTGEIAGQLIIFDLDEDPPQQMQLSSKNFADAENATFDEDTDGDQPFYRGIGGIGGESSSHGGFSDADGGRRSPYDAAGCVISSQGLTSLMSFMGGVTALLAFTTAVMCWRQCRGRAKPLAAAVDYGRAGGSAVPYDRYPPSSKRHSASTTAHHGRSDRQPHSRR